MVTRTLALLLLVVLSGCDRRLEPKPTSFTKAEFDSIATPCLSRTSRLEDLMPLARATTSGSSYVGETQRIARLCATARLALVKAGAPPSCVGMPQFVETLASTLSSAFEGKTQPYSVLKTAEVESASSGAQCAADLGVKPSQRL